jgi:hypothetical protein
VSAVVLSAVTAISPAARADDDEVDHGFSLTVSPLHLLAPMLEITGELRLADSIGVALIGGGGSVQIAETQFAVVEGGAQFRYYVFGTFDHGMQLGAEMMYVHVSGDDIANTGITGRGQGLAIGPFVGYKIATDVGFTFDAQLGAQGIVARGEAGNQTADDSAVAVLLNLNVGWSF